MSRDALVQYQQARATFDELVRGLSDPDWSAATPCSGWSVRVLVNHVTVENLWAVELFTGSTVEEVGAALDGDQLGAVPQARWADARDSAARVTGRPGAATRTVRLSSGDTTGAEYAMQLFADHLIHAWDLATAVDRPLSLDPDAVDTCLQWFSDHEDDYRSAGVIGPRPDLAADADPQTRLLASFGRTR